MSSVAGSAVGRIFVTRARAGALCVLMLLFSSTAHAQLSTDQLAAIQALVKAALASGNVVSLQAVLASMTKADPSQASDIVAAAGAAIASSGAGGDAGAAANPNADAVASAAVSAVVAAAPAEAADIVAATQESLPASLQVAVLQAMQASLAPAAGGTPTAPSNTTAAPAAPAAGNGASAVDAAAISQTAEIPRQSVASPSS